MSYPLSPTSLQQNGEPVRNRFRASVCLIRFKVKATCNLSRAPRGVCWRLGGATRLSKLYRHCASRCAPVAQASQRHGRQRQPESLQRVAATSRCNELLQRVAATAQARERSPCSVALSWERSPCSRASRRRRRKSPSSRAGAAKQPKAAQPGAAHAASTEVAIKPFEASKHEDRVVALHTCSSARQS